MPPAPGRRLFVVTILGAGAAVAILITAAAWAVLSRRLTAGREALRQVLLASQHSPLSEGAAIPDLVRDFAQRNGGRLGGPKAVRMVQRAEMRLAPAGHIIPILATQLSGTREPGFMWEATGRLGRVLPMRVLDSYVAGTGWLAVRIAGAIPVATARGHGVDRGEAMRFLAELAWNPDAVLNATGLSWLQVDALSVEVSMQTTAGTARVTLLFDSAGDIVGMTAADRPRAFGRVAVPTRWVGRFSDYGRSGDYRWPRKGEVAWDLPEGEFVYWRGEVLGLSAADG